MAYALGWRSDNRVATEFAQAAKLLKDSSTKDTKNGELD
jgi:hypothetical protein